MATKVPLGYTHTEIESAQKFDSVESLIELLREYGPSCDDFMDGVYRFEVVTETLTDGSLKSSIRIKPVD